MVHTQVQTPANIQTHRHTQTHIYICICISLSSRPLEDPMAYISSNIVNIEIPFE